MLGRIEGDEIKRIGFGHATVVNSLGGLGIEPARQLVAIRVECRHHARAMHQRGVGWNGVIHFHLVGPPIGERRAASTDTRNRISNFVAFQHVLKRGDGEAVLLREAHEHQNFIGAVGVDMHHTFLVENFDQRVELQIAARFSDTLGVDAIVRPCFLVVARRFEAVAQNLLDAHARLWIAVTSIRTPVGLFDVFTQRKFDARHRTGELQPLGVRAPAKFDDLILSANGVGRAVQQIRRRHAAGQLAVDVDVRRIDDIADAHFGGDRTG